MSHLTTILPSEISGWSSSGRRSAAVVHLGRCADVLRHPQLPVHHPQARHQRSRRPHPTPQRTVLATRNHLNSYARSAGGLDRRQRVSSSRVTCQHRHPINEPVLARFIACGHEYPVWIGSREHAQGCGEYSCRATRSAERLRLPDETVRDGFAAKGYVLCVQGHCMPVKYGLKLIPALVLRLRNVVGLAQLQVLSRRLDTVTPYGLGT